MVFGLGILSSKRGKGNMHDYDWLRSYKELFSGRKSKIKETERKKIIARVSIKGFNISCGFLYIFLK